MVTEAQSAGRGHSGRVGRQGNMYRIIYPCSYLLSPAPRPLKFHSGTSSAAIDVILAQWLVAAEIAAGERAMSEESMDREAFEPLCLFLTWWFYNRSSWYTAP